MSAPKEVPGRDPQEESTDPARPFGSLYTPDDYHWLMIENIKMEAPRSEADEEITNEIYRVAADFFKKEKVEEEKGILKAIQKTGIEVTSSSFEEKAKRIAMLSKPFEITLYQGEKRTEISFPPNRETPFRVSSIYSLFFEKLPETLYDFHATPPPYYIKDNTTAKILDREKKGYDYRLGLYSHESIFEKWLESPDDIRSVELSVSSDSGVSYLLRIPNPQSNPKGLMRFSVPSRNPFRQETMMLLLSLHDKKNEVRELDNVEYAAGKLTSAVNQVRERFWVR